MINTIHFESTQLLLTYITKHSMPSIHSITSQFFLPSFTKIISCKLQLFPFRIGNFTRNQKIDPFYTVPTANFVMQVVYLLWVETSCESNMKQPPTRWPQRPGRTEKTRRAFSASFARRTRLVLNVLLTDCKQRSSFESEVF